VELDPPNDAPVETVARPGEKVLLIAGLTALANVGYFGVGLLSDPARARTLRTPLDDAIPFVPSHMWLYTWVYTAMLYPGFVVRCPFLFRRVVLAYAVVLATCLAVWMVLPVTAIGLRADLSAVPPYGSFHEWGMWINYTLDPPLNLFPSLHVAAAFLACLCAWRAREKAGWAALPAVVGITVSVCTVKQHYVVDAVAGAALGVVAWLAIVRPARTGTRGPAELAYGWSGPLLYLLFHSSVYLALFVGYKAGWSPWLAR
jgi:membrane-associated phospholipid phosphatase